MRIALVSPNMLHLPESVVSNDPVINDLVKPKAIQFREFSPSDSLLALAGLTPEEHELVYLDDQYGRVDPDTPVALAAITAVTMNADRAYEIAAAFRERGVHTVMGGIHATMVPEEAARHVDTVITGDADRVWPIFLKDLARKKPKPRYDGGYADVQLSPPPRISLLPRTHYFRRPFQAELYTLRATAGCTRRCRFCSNWRRPECDRLHRKTLRQIEIELDQIVSFSSKALINIADDNLFLDAIFAEGVVERIRDRGIPWVGSGDVSLTRKPRLMKLLQESGCRLLCFGLESLDPRNLEWLAPWKAKQVSSYKRAIRVARDHGINVMGSFIAGLEHDDLDVYDRCIDFFLESRMSVVNVALLTPFPGTELRDRLVAEGRLDLTAPWSAYTTYNLLFRHDRFTSEQILRRMEAFIRRLESPEMQQHIIDVAIRPPASAFAPAAACQEPGEDL